MQPQSDPNFLYPSTTDPARMTNTPTNPPRVSVFRLVRNRVIAGLFVVLPIFITYVVLAWMYNLLYAYALKPISSWLRIAWKLEDKDPTWVLTLFLSVVALLLVVSLLYVAGMFFRSRLHQLVNWILLTVPGVKTIYSAVSKVFDAISHSQEPEKQFKRVVLVPFPHLNMKAPAFVTSECTDVQTGQLILCVYVPTTPIPTSGYMLLIPQNEVVDLNWDLEETLQAIVSGGITVPKKVSYFGKPPIVDQGP
jgi:uncharacterized membrane protein